MPYPAIASQYVIIHKHQLVGIGSHKLLPRSVWLYRSLFARNYKLELLMKQADITVADRKVIAAAMQREEETGAPASV